MSKKGFISEAILSFVSNGMSLPDAIDLVLGEGTYQKVVSDVYDELRARAEKALMRDAADLQEEAEAMGWDD